MRLSDNEFDLLVEEVLDSIPEEFERHMENVVVDVEDRPTPSVLRSLGLRGGRGLLGYYHGVPLTGRSVRQLVSMPDHIVIYKENIERMCRTNREVVDQVRRTVLHEVGHHFGLDEDVLRELDY